MLYPNSTGTQLNSTIIMSNNNEQKTITDFQFRIIADFFKDLDRQGPYSDDVTRQALQLIGKLPDNAKIADIGCGTGGQTITLANNIQGDITAIDIMPEFIDKLDKKVEELGLKNRITTMVGSMDKLPFSENELDLIWAEGSIYNLGYENGLKYCHKFLKTGGYIAVSEGTWFTAERPKEIEDFWMSNYSEIDLIAPKINQMQQAGYAPIAHFILPESCWWNYFNLMPALIPPFLERHNHSEITKEFVKYLEEEIVLYGKYKQYYGYVFYIGQKI